MPAKANPYRDTELFQSIFRSIPQALALVDKNGAIVENNSAFAELLGHEKDARFSGLLCDLCVTCRDANNTEAQQHNVVYYRRQNGDCFPAETRVIPIPQHQVHLHLIRDITQELEAKKQLQQQKKEKDLIWQAVLASDTNTLEQALEMSLFLVCEFTGWPVGHAYIVKDDKLVSSQAWHIDAPYKDKSLRSPVGEFQRLTMTSPLLASQELPGKVWKSKHPGWLHDMCSHPQWMRAESCSRAGLHGSFALPIKPKGEVEAVLEFFAAGPLRPNENLESLLVLFAEQIGRIFERRRGMLLISREQEKTRHILESVTEGIFGLDRHGNTAFINPAAVQMLGYPAQRLIGKPIHELILEQKDGIMAFSAETPQPWTRTQFRRADGSSMPVEFHCSGVHMDTEGGLVVTFHDISDRIQAEKLQQQLKQAQKMEALGHLTGGIAHDFNNMLASIIGYTQLAQEQKGATTHLKSYLEQVETAADRAKQLIAQMLTFSRSPGSGKLTPLKLDHLIKETAKMLRPMLPSSLEMVMEINEVTPVMADPVQIHQVFMNLCVNARDAMEGHGLLRVDLKEVKDYRVNCSSCHRQDKSRYVMLRVTDNGSGMPREVIDRMFEPFFTTKPVGKGTGMGLAMVHGIVHETGGHIEVISHRGEGTSLSLLFPVTHHKLRKTGEPSRENEQLDGNGKRILVVDDEESVARYLQARLELSGFSVTVCTSGVEAWKRFQHDSGYDMIITDQTMPKMTGVELAKNVHKLTPDMPIIICTGYSEKVDEVSSKKLGFYAYMSKPLERNRLEQTLREYFSGSTSGVASYQ